MKSKPLTEPELDRLTAVLDQFGGKAAMNLEMLDGFLVALICGPDLVPPSEYLPEIWGGDIVLEDEFAEKPILETFLSMIMRHWNAIIATLQSGDVYLPILLEDENGDWHGNDWANGFLRGMEIRREQWAPLMEDEEHGGSLVPIFALANEHNPDPEMRSYKEPVDAELRETLIVGASAALVSIYHYFEAERFLGTASISNDTTFRRSAPKTGRNDPCPCGSGKKFKHCCGKDTLH